MKKRLSSLEIDNETKRQVFWEYIKERLYGSITLLSVEITLLIHVHNMNTGHALFVVLSTIVGLWLASIFSSILASKMIHRENAHGEIIKSIVSHRWLLVSVIPSACLIALSYIPFISLEAALLSSIGFSIVGFMASIASVFIDEKRSFIANFIVISIQAIVVAGIIGIKMMSH